MRALTGSEVLVEDKLFATLDTTVRALQPENRPRVLVSDTVGFIKKLPHDLVASFRSTLAEALEASLLLFVVDASDPTYESQLEVSRSVLQRDRRGCRSVAAAAQQDRPRQRGRSRRAARKASRRDPALGEVSARTWPRCARPSSRSSRPSMVEDQLVLPYAKQGLLGDVYENARVLSEDYDATGRVMKVRGLPAAIARLRRTLAG